MENDDGPPGKRRKLDPDVIDAPTAKTVMVKEAQSSKSLQRPISPPPIKRTKASRPQLAPAEADISRTRSSSSGAPSQTEQNDQSNQAEHNEKPKYQPKFIPSPIHLTRVEGLSDSDNIDAVSLRDILNDNSIRECWNFNFLFNLDFVMEQFDGPLREEVKIKIVHGFSGWNDQRLVRLQVAARPYPNIELIGAHVPSRYGTHHSKMLILLHENHAQVVILTANMIPHEWENMTDAVWRSPLLPLLQSQTQPGPDVHHPIGSGERFKTDLLAYLRSYGSRLAKLQEQLIKYDFSAIRAAFIASTPCHQKLSTNQTSWGWVGLREILRNIDIQNETLENMPIQTEAAASPNIVMQVSSIATLSPAWLTHFQSILSTSHQRFLQNKAARPKFNIVYPTANEVHAALEGDVSGGLIHTKIEGDGPRKQLHLLHPLFCHWRHSEEISNSSQQPSPTRKAHRGPAAPHIKTYIRFNNANNHKTIDWAMLTSANLSKQAWGELPNKRGEAWIQSYECGVVVWPALFASTEEKDDAEMVPVFGKDMPAEEDVEKAGVKRTVVGFRMPYDLPLESYGRDELPWSPGASH